MAAVGTLHYNPYSVTRSGLPTFPYSAGPISAVSAPSPLDGFLTPAQLAALHSQWTTPASLINGYGSVYSSPSIPPGAAPAANVVSHHGKLHKRVGHKSNRSKSKNEDRGSAPDVALTHIKPPSASAGISTNDGSRSPTTRVTTRSILKQNLRKLSQHQDDQDNMIDLSKTAEENEERSGLGITTSRSTSDIRNTTGGFCGHARSHSLNSQHSITPGNWQPTVPVPFLSSHDNARSYTPPLVRTNTGSNEGLDFSGDVYTPPLPEDAVQRSRGATVDSSSSDAKPKLRLITTPTDIFELPPVPALQQNNTSVTSVDRISTRPRRCTNQSQISANNGELSMTPLTKASQDYLSRSKTNDPADDCTRVGTIQSARQAFEDREDDKARKQEEQEQRAHSRQQRKIAKIEEKKRRKSDAATAGVGQRVPSAATSARSHFNYNSNDTPDRPEFRSGGEYTSLESLPMPGSSSGLARGVAMSMLLHGTSEDPTKPTHLTISRRRAVKTTYVQVVAWVRTKVLNVGRRRRQKHDQ